MNRSAVSAGTMKMRFRRGRWAAVVAVFAMGASLLLAGSGTAAAADRDRPLLEPGDLLLSRTVYTATRGAVVSARMVLPAGCTTGCVLPTSDGSYPGVLDNEQVDPSFGMSSPIFLDQLRPDGRLVSTLKVPDGIGRRRSWARTT